MSFLVKGARKTKYDGYPIIEKWMVATEIPKEIIQWNCRSTCSNQSESSISFYCTDQDFQCVLINPDKYLEIFSKYQSVIGMDASPFDNMPGIIQCSQIYVNLAFTYYLGRKGYEIIPNVRLGTKRTYSSLNAYPKGTLISIGTNGFIKSKSNRKIFSDQVRLIVDKLEPSGILVYGPNIDEIFEYPREKGIPIYQYDSFIMLRNKELKNERS